MTSREITKLPRPTSSGKDNRVVLGGGYRLPAATPPSSKDSGRIRLGGGYRLPALNQK